MTTQKRTSSVVLSYPICRGFLGSGMDTNDSTVQVDFSSFVLFNVISSELAWYRRYNFLLIGCSRVNFEQWTLNFGIPRVLCFQCCCFSSCVYKLPIPVAQDVYSVSTIWSWLAILHENTWETLKTPMNHTVLNCEEES